MSNPAAMRAAYALLRRSIHTSRIVQRDLNNAGVSGESVQAKLLTQIQIAEATVDTPATR
jgi:hypothetical protein